jgi:hypothetical protein
MNGFVYLWYDRKHKRFYLGKHWGTLSDGYICSSDWMKQAYKHRPQDFKRRILEWVDDRKILADREEAWGLLIKKEELGKRYYNLKPPGGKHWHENPLMSVKVKDRIAVATKLAMAKPEVRERYLEGLKTRKKDQSLETRQKRSVSLKGKNAGKITVRLKDSDQCFSTNRDDPRWITGEIVHASTGRKMTEAERIANSIRVKESGVFNRLNASVAVCKHCGKKGNPGNISRYHNDRCKKAIA